MSFFGVTKEIIESISPHDNADKLEVAKLKGLGFQFIVGKGYWKEGDECLYFPVDSLFTDDLLLAMGVGEIVYNNKDENGMPSNIPSVVGKLSGKGKNRLKTIKLRGKVSQGMVGPISLLNGKSFDSPEGITEYLGVTKYEPPVVMEKNADLIPLPTGFSVYDIEGADRNERAVVSMMDLDVVIMEKVEGMNMSVYVNRNGEERVNQRNYSIREREGAEHSFWKVANKSKMNQLASYVLNLHPEASACAVFAEFLGPNVQPNIYGLKEHKALVFDIVLFEETEGMIVKKFLSFNEFYSHILSLGVEIVPIVSVGQTLRSALNGKTVQEFSNGKSVLADTLREGIVIKPEVESYSNDLEGRLIIKHRSSEYLLKSDN